jgi:hypothetical protein
MEPKTITLPQTTSRVIEYSLIAASFFIPFFISGPQLLTGTIVNALLFLFVSQLSSKKLLPMVMLPSIGAVLNGVLFSKFTVFLLYFLPFIWIGNYILILSFKSILLKTQSFFISLVGSSLIKCSVLFIIALVFTQYKIVPTIFLQLMGVFQLVTALMGGMIAWAIYHFSTKKND